MENVKEVVAKFEERLSIEIKKQEKLDIVEEKDFSREKLLVKYMEKILYR